jgi:hypothetical protein
MPGTLAAPFKAWSLAPLAPDLIASQRDARTAHFTNLPPQHPASSPRRSATPDPPLRSLATNTLHS